MACRSLGWAKSEEVTNKSILFTMAALCQEQAKQLIFPSEKLRGKKLYYGFPLEQVQTGEGLWWGRLGWARALLLILFQVLVTLQPRWFYRSLFHSLTLSLTHSLTISLTHSFIHSLFYSSVCKMLIKSPQTPPFPDVLLVVPNLRISCSAMQISCSITRESLTASIFARSLLTAFPLSPEQSTLMVYWFTRMVSVTNSPFSNSPFLFFPSF